MTDDKTPENSKRPILDVYASEAYAAQLDHITEMVALQFATLVGKHSDAAPPELGDEPTVVVTVLVRAWADYVLREVDDRERLAAVEKAARASVARVFDRIARGLVPALEVLRSGDG